MITRITYCRTVQVKQFEPVKIEVEGSPDSGQTAEQVIEGLRAFVADQFAIETGKKKPEPEPKKPAATKGRGAKTTSPVETADLEDVRKSAIGADPTRGATAPTTANSTATTGQTTTDPAPWEDPTTPAPKSKRSSKTEAEKQLAYALESQSLEELLERFNELRTEHAKTFSLVDWEAANKSLANVYRKLNSDLADPEIIKSISNAFRAERAYITEAAQSN